MDANTFYLDRRTNIAPDHYVTRMRLEWFEAGLCPRCGAEVEGGYGFAFGGGCGSYTFCSDWCGYIEKIID